MTIVFNCLHPQRLVLWTEPFHRLSTMHQSLLLGWAHHASPLESFSVVRPTGSQPQLHSAFIEVCVSCSKAQAARSQLWALTSQFYPSCLSFKHPSNQLQSLQCCSSHLSLKTLHDLSSIQCPLQHLYIDLSPRVWHHLVLTPSTCASSSPSPPTSCPGHLYPCQQTLIKLPDLSRCLRWHWPLAKPEVCFYYFPCYIFTFLPLL